MQDRCYSERTEENWTLWYRSSLKITVLRSSKRPDGGWQAFPRGHLDSLVVPASLGITTPTTNPCFYVPRGSGEGGGGVQAFLKRQKITQHRKNSSCTNNNGSSKHPTHTEKCAPSSRSSCSSARSPPAPASCRSPRRTRPLPPGGRPRWPLR